MQRLGATIEMEVEIYATVLANKPIPWKPMHSNKWWIRESSNFPKEG
jgi:hypothetical protein